MINIEPKHRCAASFTLCTDNIAFVWTCGPQWAPMTQIRA